MENNWPSFVKQLEYTGNEKRILYVFEICGKIYNRWDYDDYIETAIKLVSKWKPEQVTYQRITWLRSWLRENVQHNHNIIVGNVRSMEGCYKLVKKIIDAEFYYAPPELNSAKENHEKNKQIFNIK